MVLHGTPGGRGGEAEREREIRSVVLVDPCFLAESPEGSMSGCSLSQSHYPQSRGNSSGSLIELLHRFTT